MAVMYLSCPPVSGSLHRKPAVPGPQSSVGCCGGLPARVCPYDDETGSGNPSELDSSVDLHFSCVYSV